jgi:DNA-binding SARP family transcriptional activator/tetratricopeptide (TPR) repeat protein
VEFGILGPVRAWSDTGQVPVGGVKQRTLLAVLALQANRPVPAQRLLADLWPEDAGAPSRARLHDQVSTLRRALMHAGPDGADRIVAGSGGYLLRVEPDELDLDRFERLTARARSAAGTLDDFRTALALWRGPALADALPEVVERHAPRLDELRHTAAEDRFDAELAVRPGADLVDELTELVAAQPLRERLRGQLMLALYRAGRQAEALAVYREGRQRLVEELGLEAGRPLRDLQAAILRGDPSLDGPRPTAAPAPAQLPADLADFTGRTELVSRLVTSLDPEGERPVVVISGMGGLGKTSLAVRVAHRLRAAYPDAQLFADLRGVDPHPAEPADVLAALLRALGTGGPAVPADPAERAALCRSLLAPKRALLLLDNARDAAQVRPLLPGAGRVAVLVTSRDPLAGLAGAVHVAVDGFTDDEAVALLARVAGDERVAADPDAAAQVIAACGGLPLAVRIAGARLAARPRWRVRDLAERLADRRRLLSELSVGDLGVRASVELSYAALPPDTARALRLLALPDVADLSTRAVAALLDLPESAAGAVAEALVDAHLLGSAGADRYRFHDLLRVFAREVGRPEDAPGAALRRLLAEYADATRCATLAAQPGHLPDDAGQTRFAGDRAARDWLDREYRNVAALLVQVAGDPDPDTAALGAVLHQLQWYLRACGHWDDWHRASDAVCRAAVRTGDRAAELTARQYLGQLATMRSDQPAAQAQLTAALELARVLGDRRAEAATLGRLGLLAYARSEVAGSLRRHRDALAIYTALGDRHGEGGALVNIAKCLCTLGRPEEGLRQVEAGLALARETDDGDRYLMLLHQRGRCLAALGRYGDAVAAHRECLAITRRQRYREGEAYTLAELGITHLAAGRPGAALRDLDEAVQLFRALDDKLPVATYLVQVGHAHRALGAEPAARSAWRQALAVLTDLDPPAAREVRALLRQPGRRRVVDRAAG